MAMPLTSLPPPNPIAVNLRDISATKARLEVQKLRFQFRIPNSELEIQVIMKVYFYFTDT